MAIELFITPQAKQDLLDIYGYIAQENPAAAEHIYGKLQTRIESLIHNPQLGLRKPELLPSIRILIEHPYAILYKILPDTDESPIHSIIIVRVVDGRRNLPTMRF